MITPIAPNQNVAQDSDESLFSRDYFCGFTEATLAAACLICGCATRPIIVGEPRPPIGPEAMRGYRVPPRHFERIAIIYYSTGTIGSSWFI